MKKWTGCSIITILILGLGIFAFFYVKENIPKQLTSPAELVTKAEYEKKDSPLDLKEVIHHSQKLVVKIELADGSFGSGFLYNDKGDIVTNAHVVANAKEVKVKTSDSKEFTGSVIGISSEIDVALVRVKGLEGMKPLEIARNRRSELGDEVLALGSPLGFQNTVTTGIISGLDRDLNIDAFQYEDIYQVSAAIAPGNSGGPLIDRQTGEVIGINSAASNQGIIGFSIPIIDVLPLIEGWTKTPMTSFPDLTLQTSQNKNVDVGSIEEYSHYVINYFYESLNLGDYVTAYSLLGSSWQSSISYEDFREGYLHTLSVSVDDLTVTENGNQTTVLAIISAEEQNDRETVYKKYKVTYEFAYENDQLKILSGKGEEIR